MPLLIVQALPMANRKIELLPLVVGLTLGLLALAAVGPFGRR